MGEGRNNAQAGFLGPRRSAQPGPHPLAGSRASARRSAAQRGLRERRSLRRSVARLLSPLCCQPPGEFPLARLAKHAAQLSNTLGVIGHPQAMLGLMELEFNLPDGGGGHRHSRPNVGPPLPGIDQPGSSPGCGRGGSAGGRGGLGYGGGFGFAISPILSDALQGSCERERHKHCHGVWVVLDDFGESGGWRDRLALFDHAFDV